ncbi:MAG: hypothetical protein K2W95_30920 [Candidatus Obscuribacterales bacterium]|nr:hypothetical protein [Candidatus Obscuribacterales bacterium]
MFCISDKLEKELCMRLTAVIEEWGSEFVALRVPISWARLGVVRVGRVNLRFTEIDRLVIAITHPDHAYDCYQTDSILV